MSERSLNDWICDIHDLACKNGFWDSDTQHEFGTKIALITSELSEALEEYRSGKAILYYKGDKPEGVGVELVDAIIRILDLCGRYDIDVEKIMKIKHNYNANRPRKHGKAF